MDLTQLHDHGQRKGGDEEHGDEGRDVVECETVREEDVVGNDSVAALEQLCRKRHGYLFIYNICYLYIIYMLYMIYKFYILWNPPHNTVPQVERYIAL